MRYIRKGPEPQGFKTWKETEDPEGNWKPKWPIPGDIKQHVRTALFAEQGHLCCYCEVRIDNKNYQIEHFKPQIRSDVDPLDFSNMLGACRDEKDKGTPLHCGSKKQHWWDPFLLISPMDPSCEGRFRFLPDGRILPAQADDRACIETIKRLGLDEKKLQGLRRAAIEAVMPQDETAENWADFIRLHLTPDPEGKLGVHFSAVKYHSENYGRA